MWGPRGEGLLLGPAPSGEGSWDALGGSQGPHLAERSGVGVPGPLKLSGVGGYWGCPGVSTDTSRLCSSSSV